MRIIMTRVDFNVLDKIIRDDFSETRNAGNSSVCLSQFLNILSVPSDSSPPAGPRQFVLPTVSFLPYDAGSSL